MTRLVTGGCGFLGSNLADAWLSSGIDVVVADNLSRTGSETNLAWLREKHGENWRFEQLDVRDSTAISNLVDEVQPEAIAHLAGQVAMTTSINDPRLDFEINALGSFNVLDAVRRKSSDTVVLYSSTNKVYGDLQDLKYEETATRYTLPDLPFGIDESLQLDGHSPYGCSKLCADQYFRDFHRVYGLKTVVFRHSTMYGARQYATYDQGWIGWFCRLALEKKANPSAAAFDISGTGKQVRDLLHADDVVSVYDHAISHADVASGSIYNIGGGMENSLSLLELFLMLERKLDVELDFFNKAWRHGDQWVFVADVRKAQRDLEWTPTVDVKKGIQDMLDWTEQMIS